MQLKMAAVVSNETKRLEAMAATIAPQLVAMMLYPVHGETLLRKLFLSTYVAGNLSQRFFPFLGDGTVESTLEGMCNGPDSCFEHFRHTTWF